jgi:hypothetical protein
MRGSRARSIAWTAWLVLLSSPSIARAQDTTPDALLALAARYVSTFLEQFANVVTEERLEQELTTPFSSRVERRELRSDLLFVQAGAGALDWSEWRDVFEVDGRPVRDRENRLLRLFANPTGVSEGQARRLLDESARFNIGPPRDTNTPVLPLLFLLPAMQRNFAFSLDPAEHLGGIATQVLRYEERARPTVVRGTRNEDRPATGRFWIVAGGRVLRSELAIVFGGNSWRMTTDFSDDPALGLAVPVEMLERFEIDFAVVTGRATYGRFRSFSVSTGEQVEQAPQDPGAQPGVRRAD